MARKRKKIAPIKFRQPLFWDVDPKTLDSKRHARYIIERILDFGNDREVRWMRNHYSNHTIRAITKQSRGLHKPTRALWTLLTAKQ